MVHEHVWRTLCSVCATGARVARPVEVANVLYELYDELDHPWMKGNYFKKP